LVRVAKQRLASSEGKLVAPVEGYEVRGVEVGGSPTQRRIPTVLNGSVGGGRTLRVGAHVNGVRPGIADVQRKSVTHWMPDRELTRVVRTHADRGESNQRGELRLPELGSSVFAISAVETSEVDVIDRAGFTIVVALCRPLIVVNGVCGGLSIEVNVFHLW